MSQSTDVQVARERVARVFRYLQELHRVRTPPIVDLAERDWTLRLDSLPRSAYVQRGFEEDRATRPGAGEPGRSSTREFVLKSHEFVLKVGRPPQPECPEPSVVIKNWLKPHWDRVDADPSSFVRATSKAGGRKQEFEDSEERVEALEAWLETKRAWEHEARHAVKTLRVFQQLFELHARLERESEKYQLFLADGVLSLDTPSGRIHHPLLLQRVDLRFDASVPEFRLVESEDNPELYTQLLRHAGVDGLKIQETREALEREHFHPLGGDATSGFLKDLVQRVWPDGRYVQDLRDVEGCDVPVVYRQPHLLLGNRAQGLTENLERYVEALDQQDPLPESLLRVVGIESPVDASADAAPEVDALLTKPANAEQQRVIQRLEQTGAVLVQGPPGTGKSHTIANLIGHLLAQDKSILVTSHASKALRVVREKLAEPLQPLCVSVLQSDEESSRQLEESITGIVNTLASTSEKKLAREIARLEERRGKLLEQQTGLSQALQDAIRAEYEPLQVRGESLAPSDAARLVAASRGEHDWLPGPLAGEALPLSAAELDELYRLGAAIPAADEAILACPLPDPSGFPSPKEFAGLHDVLAALERSRPEDGQELWLHDEQDAEDLADLFQTAKEAVSLLHREEDWLLDCLEAGRAGGERKQAWLDLAQRIEDCAREIPEKEPLTLSHGPELRSSRPPAELLRTARALGSHLASGGKLGWLTRLRHPAWREFLEGARCDGEAPSQPEHFQALEHHLEIRALREELTRRWDRQMAGRGAPDAEALGARPETRAAPYADEMRRALEWDGGTWAACQARMSELGLDWAGLQRAASPGAPLQSEVQSLRDCVLSHLEPELEGRRRFLDWKGQKDRRAGWMAELDGYSRRDAVFPVVKQMKKAIRQGNYDAYADGRSRIEELEAAQRDFQRRGQLLERLAGAAPAWAQAVRDRRAPHDGGRVPGDVDGAWRFRCCDTRLREMARVDPGGLQERLDATREELLAVTAEYVERLAWRSQLHRTGLQEQQALTGWLGLHKKMGKGTGKNVARLKEQAKKALVACRSAVPVWIMPLSRVIESFDLATTRFDVVILDEASQSDVLGLVAFALGKEVVVVGDHEQVSPYAVGQRGDHIQALIDEILVDVPNKLLYDGRTSVYDLARQSFGGTIRLLEHFRCVPDIIQFSNALCYRGEVRALREASSSPITPPLVAHRVKGGEDRNGVNEAEALEIGALVSAMCRLEEYEGQSIGVICMVGTDQALYIDSVLRRRLSVAEYQRRQILCGNASQFQGDERDVILLSLVSSPPAGGGPLPRRQRDDVRKVFNVAASRARNQLWVVHSLDPGRDLKTGDLRLELIGHAENPAASRPERDPGRLRPRSELEKQVARALAAAGYRLHRDYPVGEYRLELVVEGEGGRRAAVQCDGDRVRVLDGLAEETERQGTLERLGWEFLRVRGSEFFRAPEEARARLEQRLEELGIRPLPPEDGAEAEPRAAGDALDAKVRRRADQIRTRWKDVPSVEEVFESAGEAEPGAD